MQKRDLLLAKILTELIKSPELLAIVIMDKLGINEMRETDLEDYLGALHDTKEDIEAMRAALKNLDSEPISDTI